MRKCLLICRIPHRRIIFDDYSEDEDDRDSNSQVICCPSDAKYLSIKNK